MSHNPKGLGKLLIKPPTWNRSTPAAPPSTDKSGEMHPQRGNCFFESRARQNDRHQHCQLVPDQPRKDSQLFFGCWQARLLGGRRSPVYPQGKEPEIPGGNQRRRSAGGTFPAPQAPVELAEPGLDGVERTPRIRRNLNDVVNGCWRVSRPASAGTSGVFLVRPAGVGLAVLLRQFGGCGGEFVGAVGLA